MDKKIAGSAAAVVGALLYGGAQLMGMDERLIALEELHPEIAQDKANEAAEELKTEKPEKPEKASEPAEKTEPPEEPDEEPESAPEPAEDPLLDAIEEG